MDLGYEVLLVSNFTLYGGLKSIFMSTIEFTNSREEAWLSWFQYLFFYPYDFELVGPDAARKLFEDFVNYVKCDYKSDKVQQGEFQAYMTVNMVFFNSMKHIIYRREMVPLPWSLIPPNIPEQRKKSEERCKRN